MVISGGNFKPDTLKPKEVVSLLLDDEEIERKCKSPHFDPFSHSSPSEILQVEWGENVSESVLGNWEIKCCWMFL